MRIATWNCNSIRARLDFMLEWLGRDPVDVLCLQETKIQDREFPHAAFAAAGYRVAAHGQRTYNGVAIAWREDRTVDRIEIGLGDAELDTQSRVIAAIVDGVRVVSVYVPNGKSVEHIDFQMKLHFFERLRARVGELAGPDDAAIVCGDFNVAPDDRDVYDPVAWGDAIHCHPDERAALARLIEWGLVDAYRIKHVEGGAFTWWDYRGAAFRFDHGLRIDMILVTKPLAERVSACEILRNERKVKGKARLKPSDHAPVVVELRR